jgi:spermidine synthase
MFIERQSIEKEESMRPACSKTAAVDAPSQTAHPPATISEHKGVRYLHLGTEWEQGAMRMRKPDAIETEYLQQMMLWMLFNQQPQHIVQLGLGSAALTKFCYRQFPDARVTAIELNPAVIAICGSMFALPPNDARLNVAEMDAIDFVMDSANHGTSDVLQVDLYDAKARGPVFDTSEFYQACADCLKPDGMMTVNLFGEQSSYAKNLQAMQQAFDAVVWLPEVHAANIVVIAFKRAPELDFTTLYERAVLIKKKMKLPAQSWVDGLKEWMLEQ